VYSKATVLIKPPPRLHLFIRQYGNKGVGGDAAQHRKDLSDESKRYLSEVERRDLEMVSQKQTIK